MRKIKVENPNDLKKIHWKDAVFNKYIHPNLLLDKVPKSLNDKGIIVTSKIYNNGKPFIIILDRDYFLEKFIRHFGVYFINNEALIQDYLIEVMSLAKNRDNLKLGK